MLMFKLIFMFFYNAEISILDSKLHTGTHVSILAPKSCIWQTAVLGADGVRINSATVRLWVLLQSCVKGKHISLRDTKPLAVWNNEDLNEMNPLVPPKVCPKVGDSYHL